MNLQLFTNATLLSIAAPPLDKAYLLAEGDTILAVGDMATCPTPADAQIHDCTGKTIMAGMIDAHSHLGLYEQGLGFEGADGNEDSEPTTPHLRVIDAINPMDAAFAETLAAGITIAAVTPGSANPIGGQIALLRTHGRRIDDMVLRTPIAVKFAFGENPKATYHDREESPVTRMATASLMREALHKARQYGTHLNRSLQDEDEDEPDYDMHCEALLPLLAGDQTAHMHAHRADDIFTALRIAKEFEMHPVLVHATEGYLIADILAEENVPVLAGPLLCDRSKPELRLQSDANVALLDQAGVRVAITSDHPDSPAKHLRMSAGMAVQHGLPQDRALRALTLTPAEILGIADRFGSLEAGKEANFAIYSGHPLDWQTKVEQVWAEGVQVL